MILDPTNQFIATILSHYDLSGKDVLEIGCGKGRITKDLAIHAKLVTATDPDSAALAEARTNIVADNVVIIHTPTGVSDISAGTFDLAIFTLSLHHILVDDMSGSLKAATGLLRKDGVIIVIEPGMGGSFIEAEEQFRLGCGNERTAKEAAIRAVHSLEGWLVEETVQFRTLFQFDDEGDFLVNMLPNHRQQTQSFVKKIRGLLARHRTNDGIILDADRRLNLLRQTTLVDPYEN